MEVTKVLVVEQTVGGQFRRSSALVMLLLLLGVEQPAAWRCSDEDQVRAARPRPARMAAGRDQPIAHDCDQSRHAGR
ncbi:MAG: hypothetical protein H6518_00390 [Microthrixaceae bacterium]|nr:hypothetical protein [Microthrixaceae bacterium]